MTLVAAVRSLVHDGPRPPKAIADDAGVGYAYLLKAADDAQPDVQFQARWIGPVTRAAGNCVLIQYLAKECGGVFFQPRRCSSNTSHTARTLKEFSDYLATYAQHEDKGFTKFEVEEIEQEAHDVISALLCQIDKLKADAR